MTVYEVLKTYGTGKGEATMWATTKLVSDAIEEAYADNPEAREKIIRDLYAIIAGCHYNEPFAMAEIKRMSYIDGNGVKVESPHWTKSEYQAAYESVRNKLKKSTYNVWDLAVTLEMQYSDYICTLREWWPSATNEDLDVKVVQLAIAYLNDPDDPEDGKIWRRFN